MVGQKNPLKDKYYLLGKRIQHLRIKRGMTQERLAEEAKISVQHLSKVENGKEKPSFDLLMRIATILDYRVGDLITF
jgi:transcriptional regulator with XRE-family HTH domain